MPNPKCLDQFHRNRSPVNQSDYPSDDWAVAVSGKWVVLHFPMVPHVISTKVESKSLAEAAPTQHTLPFLIPPLSKRQEQGRENGDWRWRWKPRSSSHQAQVIPLLSIVMVSSWALISIIWVFLSKPNLKSLMHVWIMECGDLFFITKVRLRPYAWLIISFPLNVLLMPFLWIFARISRNGSFVSSSMKSKMCSSFFSWSWSSYNLQNLELSSHGSTLILSLELSWLVSCTNP
jgi:hypothetical protein